jgi:hypothetical protein
MNVIFLNYWLAGFVVLLSFYVVGSALWAIIHTETEGVYTQIFFKLLWGMMAWVWLTALFFTRGVTVFWAFLPLAISLAILNTPSFSFSRWWGRFRESVNLQKKSVYVVILVFFLVFAWRFGSIYQANQLPLVPHGDSVFYANCIDFMMATGKENSSLDYIYPSGVSPYHYFELWLTAGFVQVFGFNTALALLLITFTLGLLLVFVGFCAIEEHWQPITWLSLVRNLGLLFACGVVFSWYQQIGFMQYIMVYARNLSNYPKLFPIYLFLLAALHRLQKNKPEEAFIWLLCLPLVSISTAIGVIPGLMLWLTWRAYRQKRLDYTLWAVGILVPLWIFLFYKILTEQADTHVSTNFGDVLANLNRLKFLRTAFNIGIGATLQMILIYLPFLLIANRKPQRTWLNITGVQWLVFFYLFSLSGWAALHQKTSSTQIFTNLSTSMLNIAACYLLIRVGAQLGSFRQNWQYAGIVFCIIWGVRTALPEYRFGYAQHPEYLHAIHEQSEKLSDLGAFMYGQADYAQIPFSYISNFAIQGSYLIYLDKHTFPLSITPHLYHVNAYSPDKAMEESALHNTPFYKYAEAQKQRGNFKSWEKLQWEFIQQYGINYIIASKNAIVPYQCEPYIKQRWVDPNTGERFILLK